MKVISKIAIIPEPVSLILSDGTFTISEDTLIYSDLNLFGISEYLKNLIYPATGFDLKIEEFNNANTGENSIYLILFNDNSLLDTEGYKLEISLKNIVISARNPAGIFYGIQTLRQLFPAEIEYGMITKNVDWEIPCLKIKDYPRFKWRGFMLDEARHFHGKKVVKRLLDLISLFKINVFHWHLTDDQGWRIEIKKYPKLVEVGSKREETQVGARFSKKRDGIPHSGYYTQKEIQEIIEYAKSRFIKVIPEIDLPGHTRAALASYPNLSCKRYPFRVSTHWGFHRDVLCVGKEEVFEFINNVLKEIINLFPSNIIHIGGDEVLKDRWKKCSECQNRIEAEGLKNENQLQSYFINRVVKYLSSNGQEVICWNDVLNKSMTENIVCQYWRLGKKKVLDYIRKGGDLINSDFKYTYLDHSYSFTPLKLAYKFEPIPKKLNEKYHKHVLGLEAPMWGEFTPNIKRLEWQTFPRLMAFAEIGWTPKIKKDFTSFHKRHSKLLKRFDIMGVNYANSEEVKGSFFKKIFKWFTLLTEEKGGT